MSTPIKTPPSVNTSEDPGLEYLNQREIEVAITPVENTTKDIVFEEVTQIITNVFQFNAPSGANGQLQFNQNGSYIGDAELQYDPNTDTLTTGKIIANSITITGNASTFKLPGGNNNDVLKTDGTGNLSWANVFPTVAGNTGKFLVTNGVSIDWSTTNYNSLATTTYVSTAIADLVGTAPAMLNTLAEIANVIGQTNDPQFGIISQLANKANISSLSQVAFSGSYADLSNRPNISTVGNTGKYSDLNGIPTIPTTINDLGISDGTVGQVLTTRGNGTYHFTTVTSGSNANIGNIGFSNTVIYSNTGTVINNSDLSNGQTAGLVIPAQGDGNTSALFNTYGNVTILAGNIGNSQPVQAWTFNPAGALFFPQTPYVTSAILVNDNNQELSVSTDRGNISIWPENSKWLFGADGKLTLPAPLATLTNVSQLVTDTAKIYRATNSTDAADIADAKDTWTNAELVWTDIVNQDYQISGYTWPWTGKPSWEGYPLLMNYNSSGTPVPGVTPPSSALAPAGNSANQAYLAYKQLLSSIDIVSGNKTFSFENTGALRVPGVITKDNSLMLVSSGVNGILPNGNSAAVNPDGQYGRVLIRTDDGTTLRTWTFDVNGNLTLPSGGDIIRDGTSVLGTNTLDSVTDNGSTTTNNITVGSVSLTNGSAITETATTTVITPPTALAGQSLVVRPTGATGIISDHPGGFTDGDTITLTVTPDYNYNTVTGTVDYTFTGCTQVQLGRALTGTLTFTNETAKPISWTIPVSSTMTTFTITLSNAVGFDISTIAPLTLSTTGSSEDHHIHLIAGDPTTTDIYLGDDDQYVKIEKNAGNVVIGTNVDNNHWTFDTGGKLTLPQGSQISETAGVSTDITVNAKKWEFDVNGNLTLPTGGTLIVSGGIVSSGASPAPTLSGFSSVSALEFKNGTSNVTVNANSNLWKFDSTGNLTIPGTSGGFIKTVSNASIGIAAVDNGTDNPAQLLSINAGSGAATSIVSAYATNATIQTNATGAINTWKFDNAGNLTLPANTFAINYANGIQVSLGSGSSSNISNGNSNVSIATANGNVTIASAGNTTMTITGTGANITGTLNVTGNISTSTGTFVGNGAGLTNVTVNAAGNIQGTSSNVSLVAGSYTMTFDNTGILTLPRMGGDEGGEINFGIPASNTTLTTRVAVDIYQDRFRIFDGSTKGVYIDLSQAGTGVGTLLNNRVSGLVNAGTFVTMDLIKATVTTTGNRGLSLATTTGTFSYNIGGNFGISGAGSGGQSLAGQTLTTTATTSIFGWGFTSTGDTATYVLTDTTNSRCYRITLQIGTSFNNNMISIERLI